MVMVTEEQVREAETAAEQAGRELKEAARRYAGNPGSVDAYNRHQEAVGRADHAKARVQVLRGDFEAQQAVRQARAAEGAAVAREMAKDVEGLTASRQAAVRAVVEAEAAMGRALAALDAHDRAVRAAGAELLKRGLQVGDGEETGVHLDGSPRIAGTKWPLVDGAGVLGHCLAEGVAARWPRHPLARPLLAAYGGLSAGEGRATVLALVRAERGR
ncbi:hypothetical protein ACIQSP_19850 [Streptomyces nigra]|uniref:hypothetical protein n=1 Tax=Streptomyces nigra TaxID=1827580 RepID=UPI00381794A6